MSSTNTPTPTPTPSPTPTPAPTPTPTPMPTAAWHEGKLSAEDVGYFQNKGWDVADPTGFAAKSAESYRQLERMIGVPGDKVLRLPEANDEAGIKQVMQRFGVPADEKGYDFSLVKKADGTNLAPEISAQIAAVAAKHNVTSEGAKAIVVEFVKAQDGAEATANGAKVEALQAARQRLAANWGTNMEANMFTAKQAATALGVTPEAVAALESQIGYDQTMEFFRNVGARIGEDRYVANGGSGDNKVMTAGQAADRISQLKADPDWSKRYLNGGIESKEYKELTGLITLVNGARGGNA